MSGTRHLALARHSRGFTLTEVLVTLVILLILSSLAYPIAMNQIARGRRAEAIAALMAMQQAQERWRGQHAAYATLAELGLSATTSDQRYALSVESAAAAAYTLASRELVRGGADRNCFVLKLISSGGQTTQASGADDAVTNAEAANRRCWNQ